ncbi:hypothetical protein M231_07896 [Tremella mesenterica]|uniref:Uncharacterized protein n=1 Tax=Tremella mesenterica TaxID=5217 RepID=A0A4V1M2X1_TREME|nr:hypothetical protein M231_07896 [Tremella mesenterica]
MSYLSPPPPPPAGVIVPSDDWTDDPSFDLSPAQSFVAPPWSPSSSSSSRSHHSFSSIRSHTSSPLRNTLSKASPPHPPPTHTQPTQPADKPSRVDWDDDELDFDLPDSFPALPSRSPSFSPTSIPFPSTTNSSLTRLDKPTPNTRGTPMKQGTGTMNKLSGTVIGHGPKGGTITKLGSTQSPFSRNTIRAHLKATSLAWEADLDFDSIPSAFPSVSAQRTDSWANTLNSNMLPKPRIMPDADALDELGFDLEDDEATLKAGATLKALLPPKRNDDTIRPHNRSSPAPLADRPNAPNQDLDLESDLILPLNLTNLSLASQSRPTPKPSKTEWDSPGGSTSSSAHKQSNWDDSPGRSKRAYETSHTSLSINSPDRDLAFPLTKKEGVKDVKLGSSQMEDETDMEIGLVIPTLNFFSTARAKELNNILDRKRKPQFAPPQPQTNALRGEELGGGRHKRHGTDDTSETVDSFEDGLVLDNPPVDLSQHRLRKAGRVRAGGIGSGLLPPPSSRRKGLTTIGKEKWERWKGTSGVYPFLQTVKEKASTSNQESSSSSLCLKISSENTNRRPSSPLIKEFDPTATPSKRQLSSIPLSSQKGTMPPPPTSLLTPGSRLRHQKSHYHLSQPPQSPLLSRKQSLSSLQDALNHDAPIGLPSTSSISSITSLPSLPLSSQTKTGSGFSLTDGRSDRTSSLGRTTGSNHSVPSSLSSQTGSTFSAPAVGSVHGGISESLSTTSISGQTGRYHNSTSRLTMPTTSTRAKMRPPVQNVFSPNPPSTTVGSNKNVTTMKDKDLPTGTFGASKSAGSLRETSGGFGSSKSVTSLRDTSGGFGASKSTGALKDLSIGGKRLIPRVMEVPKRIRNWGDGTELEGIEDLEVEKNAPSPPRQIGSWSRRERKDVEVGEKRKKGVSGGIGGTNGLGVTGGTGATGGSGGSGGSGSRRKVLKRPALLIKHLGGVDKKKVVGDMTWNPTTLRWEGNESVLRDFESVSSSTRPALITHYTAGTTTIHPHPAPHSSHASSHIQTSQSSQPSQIHTSHPRSNLEAEKPHALTAAATIRIVGDMRFDPLQMCWVSLVDEEDPFEGMADDEDDSPIGAMNSFGVGPPLGGADGGGNTITRATGRRLINILPHSHNTSVSSRLASESSATSSVGFPFSGWGRNPVSGGEWAEGRKYEGYEIPHSLVSECREAEERHKREMRGWTGLRLRSGTVGVAGVGGLSNNLVAIGNVGVVGVVGAAGVGEVGARGGGEGGGGGGGEDMRFLEDRKREEKRLWELRGLVMKS